MSNKTWKKPGILQVAHAVGRVSFSEIIRDKVLYNILLCAFLLLGLGIFASRVTVLKQDRLILNFGVSAVTLSCVMIAIFVGAGLIGREFERRTILVALSRPISRFQFVVGKFLGLAAVLALNWFLLSLAYLAILSFMASSVFSGPEFFQTLTWALVLILFQSWMMAGIAVLFSSFTTTSLSVIMSLGIYLVGNNISQIRMLAARAESGVGEMTLKGVAAALPNLEYFTLGTQVTYGLPVSLQFGLTSIAYSLVVISVALLMSGFLLQGRES